MESCCYCSQKDVPIIVFNNFLSGKLLYVCTRCAKFKKKLLSKLCLEFIKITPGRKKKSIRNRKIYQEKYLEEVL